MFGRRRRQRRVFTRQIYLEGGFVSTAGDTAVGDSVFTFEELLGVSGNWGAAQGTKSITIVGWHLYTDFCFTNTVAALPVLFRECFFKIQTDGSSFPYLGTNFLGINEWTGANAPEAIPHSMVYRRATWANGVAGNTASASNLWFPIHSKQKMRLLPNEGFVWHVEVQNFGSEEVEGTQIMLGALHIILTN